MMNLERLQQNKEMVIQQDAHWIMIILIKITN